MLPELELGCPVLVSSSVQALSSEERSRLHTLERTIERHLSSFLECGKSLAEIRDTRLYRASHLTFESYCRDRWALSLSRCNQLISTVKVYDNLTAVFPQDATLLEDANEHALRPLGRLEPELQTATWELIKRIEERPAGTTIAVVVDRIKAAITDGWQERDIEAVSTGAVVAADVDNPESVPEENPAQTTARVGTTRPRRTIERRSNELGTLCRWAARIANWDAESVALSDDQLCLQRHLRAARQLRTFCDTFIQALETRLAGTA